MTVNSQRLLLAAAGAGGAAAGGLYVDDVFSTWLYTGNGSTQTITNGIDLAGEGGLVWIKQRSLANTHRLFDTLRGVEIALSTALTGANTTRTGSLTAFNSDGFNLGNDSTTNGSGETHASWTFRKAPGFFDVVTYTGNGTSQNISHNLGSVPGCIIVKRTSSAFDWNVYHRSPGAGQYARLNTTGAFSASNANWNNTTPTSTVFTVGTGNGTNASGETYVAYLFAHDDAQFGENEDESIIKCGSYVATYAPNLVVNLGWEPQWVLIKSAGTSNWSLVDNMRGVTTGNDDAILRANLSNAEYSSNDIEFTATGFTIQSQSSSFNFPSGETYIYIAIRRPHKPPEAGTDVFAAQTDNQTGNGYYAELGTPVDAWWYVYGRNTTHNTLARTRLTGGNYLNTSSTSAETTQTTSYFDKNLGVKPSGAVSTDANNLSWVFRRAPGFFDVVAYTGTGSALTVNHNLGVAPELMIIKRRDDVANWPVYHQALGASAYLWLNATGGEGSNSGNFNATTPTASSFSVGGANNTNASSGTYIAYLFATLSGISKVGSYTGTGSTLNVDCGFTAGARFVLIKRTDSTGDWYLWDSTRGIVSGNDPYLLLNSTAAEVTSTDYIDPLNSGFTVTSSAPAALNASGGSYIFLAIA